jgi:hypothetical protein
MLHVPMNELDAVGERVPLSVAEFDLHNALRDSRTANSIAGSADHGGELFWGHGSSNPDHGAITVLFLWSLLEALWPQVDDRAVVGNKAIIRMTNDGAAVAGVIEKFVPSH